MTDNAEAEIPQLSPQERVDALVTLLTLDNDGENRFVGRRKIGGVGRIFGGQVVAQALAAAFRTVDEERKPHSLHAYFLRGGDEDFPIEFEVDRQFDGGSFSNRRVVASQKGRPILNLAASFHKGEDGPGHAVPMPGVLPPEDLRSEAELTAGSSKESKFFKHMRRNRAYEVRMPDEMALESRANVERPYMWFRTLAPLPDDAQLHRLVLAYLSDYGLLSASKLRHGGSRWSEVRKAASLDHAIWYHSDARADDWLLYAFESPWTGSSRGFNRGSFYTRDGRLVASTAQEGLMRFNTDDNE
ncbi:acyl-CoA thioesterase [Croceicoccus gelatinilyticus]|uniref:acyl-CoA thioesterase n=1 Tax=Croceicoccus gelatinilyticus TaxID=2835536 RepID=UPI001BCCB28B|nr:acyl-CoA thioesterase domain-containing protein [Croceicoccus gelatinilyticus]MBS7670789.1 thioesterase family protein [Croceicoccus gelatinilyticus]